ncbi:MAG: 30S ribosomal protein S6 [Tissierellia bacterium]|nr:30S ribosomal protein S6 [Tissierellia bacterium]
MNKYETVLMFYPDAEEEQKKAHFERLQKIISEAGKINNIDEWGKRKLAYEIEYYQEADYVLLEYEAEAETIKEFDRIAKILDTVMRHMIIRVDR